MKLILIVLLFAQHHIAFSGSVLIPKSGSVIVHFDPPFAPDKPIPSCFLKVSPIGKVKAKTTSREWVEIVAAAGSEVSYNCTTERQAPQ